MKIFKIPQNIRCIIFDIDSTLYTHEEYAREQIDVQLRHFAKIRNLGEQTARDMIEDFRSEYAQTHEKKISLGNTLVHFGISIAQSIQWRETLIEPARYLVSDPLLAVTLKKLTAHFTLIAVTNNPVLPAQKTLKALSVSEFFSELIGLDTTGVSKPHKKPFLAAAERAEAQNEECLSVGDRYDIDIALPLELGMGGILVDGVTDVYSLPSILLPHTYSNNDQAH